MAHKIVEEMDVAVASTGVGLPVDLRSSSSYTIYVTGTFVGTLFTQISADGVNYINQAQATGGLVNDQTLNAAFIRINVTAYTSGQPVVHIVKQNLV